MGDYQKVQQALQDGADPGVLCATCPWDRFCITPPSMTSEDVKAAMDKASENDKVAAEKAKAEGKDVGMPVGILITALATGGRDTQAQICPVMALRLRSSEGERVVQSVKHQMRAWDDNEVSAS